MIDRPLARFLEEGLSLYVGARDERLQPMGARALAVKVDEDGMHLVVYVAEVARARLVPSLESTCQATVSVARPTDERACQVKGIVVGIRPASEAERADVDAQWDGFMRQLELIGIPRSMAANWSVWPALAIRLKVTAVFEQTPGPQAGQALG